MMVSFNERSPASAQPPASEFSERVVGLDRIHAADERMPHLALGRDDRFGTRHDVLDKLARDYHDTVAIAEQPITGGDGRFADANRLTVSLGNPALDDIG